jgi:hypothetical protein
MNLNQTGEQDGKTAEPTVPLEGPMRDAVSGLTQQEMWDFNEFLFGPGYDSDPERRCIREHGGHCSGGAGPC